MNAQFHHRIRHELSRLSNLSESLGGPFKQVLWPIFIIAAVLWLIAAWQLSGWHRDQRIQNLIEHKGRQAHESILGFSFNIGHTLNVQKGTAVVLANEPEIRHALKSAPLRALSPAIDQDLRRKSLNNDHSLPEINRFLRLSAEQFGADLIFVINQTGICIATSNAGLPGDLSGSNFSFREYFKQAQIGQIGRQYGIGVISGVPGIFLAMPIMADHGFLGTVVVKLNIERLSAFLEHADGFISDSDGVIILAKNKPLTYQVLPGAKIDHLTAANRLGRYGKIDLQYLGWQLRPATKGSQLVSTTVSTQPLLLANAEVSPGWLKVSVLHQLPELERFATERDWLFLLLSIIGILFLVALANALAFWRTRGKARQALSEQGLRLDQAQRVAQLGSWQRKSLSDPVLWSDEIFDIYEIAPNPQGISAREFIQRVHPDDLSALKTAYRLLFSKGQAYEISHRLIFPQGRLKYVLQRGETIVDERGQTRLYVGTLQDISVRKQMENALHDSEETYRTIFEVSTDALAVIDPETARFITCNDAALKLFGLTTPEQLLGHTPAHFSPPLQANGETSAQMVAFNIVKTTNEGRTSFEWLHLNSEGKLLTVMVSLCSLHLQGEHRILAIMRDFTERKLLEQRLAELAHTDSLTGLSNRRHFIDRADAEIARARRYNEPLSLFMIDIDHFKLINDSRGHQTGDLVLQKMATLCRETLREVDLVSRIGGEEFAVLLPETTLEDALLLAERLRQHIAESKLVLEHGLPLQISISVGVTALENNECNLDTLLSQADTALYAAKNAGRNRVCVHQAAN